MIDIQDRARLAEKVCPAYSHIGEAAWVIKADRVLMVFSYTEKYTHLGSFPMVEWNPAGILYQWKALVEFIAGKLASIDFRPDDWEKGIVPKWQHDGWLYIASKDTDALERLALGLIND